MSIHDTAPAFLKLQTTLQHEAWRMKEPFEIAGQVIENLPLIHLCLSDGNGHTGHAEAAGMDYDGETLESMSAQLTPLLDRLTSHTRPVDIQDWLPAGGARNVLDCALWDLWAKQSGVPVWKRLGLQPWKPTLTAVTIGLGTLEEVVRRAAGLRQAPLIKIKVDADRHLAYIERIRAAAPHARLLLDANQAWTLEQLRDLMPTLQSLGVEAIEQPLARGADAALADYRSPIPLVADESCLDVSSLVYVESRYQGINIKLDKCGGLTQALALAQQARARGLLIMVGNMCGTSLGMAAAFALTAWADWVDLDGPIMQEQDREHPLSFDADTSILHPPSTQLWS